MPADVGALRRVGLVALVVAGFLLVAGVAMAYWSSAGTGTASASTGTLNAPTAVTASGVGSVTVSWTGSTGTTAPQGYYVVRTRTSDGVTTPACGTSRTALTASSSTSCTDTGVPAGTFTYAGHAVVGGWTATSVSSASLTITSTGLLSFTTPAGRGHRRHGPDHAADGHDEELQRHRPERGRCRYPRADGPRQRDADLHERAPRRPRSQASRRSRAAASTGPAPTR